ncbi:helix-turn-helix transcriptional regulator [Ciceribacter sp. L1K22]|uniref:helix-turn-helix transcriptional regulator n=1 Tax=Ciceribacter sp. L1K22 TaxID=2820275 RepID=UPI001ABE2AFE|nr:helix-turn-helix transcriptional regulator [Ciceribacter sp. L1K22]MBO3760085.1 helix-turn-helix transcriptional regulator [Ciceribacter sp. L1K22]
MDRDFSELIGSIYDCVAREHAWGQALSLINRKTNGFLTTLAIFDTGTRAASLAQVACDDQEAIQVLAAHAKDVPFFHLLQQMNIDEPDTLARMFRLYGHDGESVWRNGALYQNFHARYGVLDSIDMAVLKRPTRVGTLNISVKYQPTDRRLFELVAMLGPHIRRAVTIHDMLEMERTESAVLREVIEVLHHAVFIVGDDMEILFANAAAEERLRDQTVVQQRSGKLVAQFPHANLALKKAVILGSRDEIGLGAEGIDLPLGSSDRPAVAHVLPLRRRTKAGRFESRASAAIFVASAGAVVQTAIEAVAALFGLTPAERRVVAYVSEGLTRSEISEAQGVSDGTVKSQLGAIYDKTNTSDQRALQQLVKELTPPVRR